MPCTVRGKVSDCLHTFVPSPSSWGGHLYTWMCYASALAFTPLGPTSVGCLRSWVAAVVLGGALNLGKPPARYI